MTARMKDTLLLIGDENSDRTEMHKVFEPQYYLLEAENIMQGTLLLKQNSPCIAAIVADIPLKEEQAIRELVEASKPDAESEIPIIFLVSSKGIGEEERAFLLGAADVVKKPYAKLSIQQRLQILVDLYLHKQKLESLVTNQNQVIRKFYQNILDTMVTIIEHRSVESGNHVLRIRGFAKILLEEFARCNPEYKLTEESIDAISSATALHDVGKIVIPDAILNKPGPLTPEEFEIMKTHTTWGAELIAKINSTEEMGYLNYAYNICLYHHERWDGGGYPKGLKGEEIPICAQVAGITDAFDALTTQRVYKSAISYKKAINMILNGECGVFSPQLLDCFKRVSRKLMRLAEQYLDGQTPNTQDVTEAIPLPEQQALSLDAIQLSRLKYQAILHYLNDTVVELDLDAQLYHVVYNPSPNFLQLMDEKRFDFTFQGVMMAGVHPEDLADMEYQQKEVFKKLFEKNQRKCSFRSRIFNPALDRYDLYEITTLHVKTMDPNQRIAIVVFHNLQTDQTTPPKAITRFLEAPELYDLMSASLCCAFDENLSVLDGSNMLLHLTGYTPKELKEEFGNAFINMVFPQDRDVLQAMLNKVEEQANRQDGQFRILCKTGTPIWVLGKCRVRTEPDGTRRLYFGLTDISPVKAEQQLLTKENSRLQMIAEQFKNIILEWNLVTDELVYSAQWKERFGYDIDTKSFGQVLKKSCHIHPDDLPQLREKIKNLQQQEAKDFMDLRIADGEGRYCWNRIRAASRTEGQEKPTSIVAVVYDINDLKHDAITMKQQAEQDGLTRLLNKASTQQAVTDYLETKEPERLAAMLILDVDNFKTINDSFGHLYGDAVLAQIGSTLRNLFRSQDIVGRIGGDEFLVLLKDLPNVELVKDRCELLVSTFRQQLQTLMPELPVSISVGCALVPVHGSTSGELFIHADEALYKAKNKGKCQYKIYDPQNTYQTAIKTAGHTSIESDQQVGLNENVLIRQMFHNLYTSKDLNASVNEVLAFVGEYFNVSRVYIFENTDDDTGCKNTFEWCNAGIEPQIDNLQEVNYARDVPSWQSSFDETGILYSTDIQKLAPDLREILEPQGIKSLLHCAMLDQGVFRGVVGFDECNASYMWTKEQIEILSFLAEVLSVFLLKQRKDT